MPNEQLIKVSDKVAAEGAIAVGPFAVGKVYSVPDDALALLGDKFEAATLKKDETVVALGGFQSQHIADLRAQKKAMAAAKAEADKAIAEAAKAAGEASVVPAVAPIKTTPAAAGSVTGG